MSTTPGDRPRRAGTTDERGEGGETGLPQAFSAGKFVGRHGELRELSCGLDNAFSGHGELFMVGGEPGIGKSRLADELSARARERGACVLWGRCWEAGGAPAYWPWVQSIRSYIRDQRPAVLRSQLGTGGRHLAQILPELCAIFPDIPSPPPSDAEGTRFLLFDSIASFLINAARERPLLIVLDDLHAADTPSLLLLQFLAGQLGSSHIMIIGTYRDTELDRHHPFTSSLCDLTREQTCRGILLRGLTEAESARFVEMAAGSQPSESLVTSVYRETEGNPLFLGEVVRLLAHEGRLGDAGDSRGLRLNIPPSVRRVIALRIGHLSDECNKVLAVASVLGREFRLDALLQVSQVPEERLYAALHEASTARVIVDVPGAVWLLRFSHALIRDVFYDELTPTERVWLHQRAGLVLEGIYGSHRDAHLAELAHHFLQAMPRYNVDKAVTYARAAGDRAARLLAYEEAARLYSMALQAMEMMAGEDKTMLCELLLSQGDAQMRAGRMAPSKEAFRAAAELARKLALPEHFARAALGYGGQFVWQRAGSDPYMVPLLREALEATGEVENGLQVRLLARLAGATRDQVVREPRALLSGKAVRMARRIGDLEALAYALDGRYAATWWPENAEDRLAVATELIAVAKEAGDKERHLQGHHYRLIALLELGDLSAVYQELEAKAQLAEALRQPAQRWYVAVVRSMLAIFDGRFEEAERLSEEALRIGLLAQSPQAVTSHTLQRFIIAREQGRLSELEPILRAAIAENPWYPMYRCMLAHMYAELGRREEACGLFSELASNDFDVLPLDNEWLFGMTLLPKVAAFLNDVPRAASLYRLLLPYSEFNIVAPAEVSMGSVSRSLGILASILGRYDEAAEHFEAALAKNTKMGALPWLAHTQADYGHMLLSRGLRGEAAKAVQLLTQALQAAEDMGMFALSKRVSTLLDDARAWIDPRGKLTHGRVPFLKGAANPAGELTRREREVLSLLARGYSNRKIGEELVISERTVEIHVSRILGKLGFASRAQAAIYAAEQAILAAPRQ